MLLLVRISLTSCLFNLHISKGRDFGLLLDDFLLLAHVRVICVLLY